GQRRADVVRHARAAPHPSAPVFQQILSAPSGHAQSPVKCPRTPSRLLDWYTDRSSVGGSCACSSRTIRLAAVNARPSWTVRSCPGADSQPTPSQSRQTSSIHTPAVFPAPLHRSHTAGAVTCCCDLTRSPRLRSALSPPHPLP